MTALQGSAHSSRPATVPEVFGQHLSSQAHGDSWGSLVQDWESDSMIIVGPFQLWTFYESLNCGTQLKIQIECFLNFWLLLPKSCAAEPCSLLPVSQSAPEWPAPRRLSTVNFCYMLLLLKLLKVILISAFTRRKIIPTSHSCRGEKL